MVICPSIWSFQILKILYSIIFMFICCFSSIRTNGQVRTIIQINIHKYISWYCWIYKEFCNLIWSWKWLWIHIEEKQNVFSSCRTNLKPRPCCWIIFRVTMRRRTRMYNKCSCVWSNISFGISAISLIWDLSECKVKTFWMAYKCFFWASHRVDFWI